MMKENKHNYLHLLLLAIVGCFVFSACSDDDFTGNNDNPSSQDAAQDTAAIDTSKIKVIAGDSICLTASQLADSLYGPAGSNSGDSTNAARRELFMKNVQAAEDSLERVNGANGIAISFVIQEFQYESKDEYGNPIWLSGKAVWGKYWFGGWHYANPENLYLYEHYTILTDAECPSKSSFKMELISVGPNVLTILPDYIGYGKTRNKVHPYLNHEVCAINSIDAMEAGYKLFMQCTDKNTKMKDNWKMYVLGCSQGGGNALAVHKYLDTHLDMANKWHFAYSYCSSGPYSPRKTMDYYYDSGKLTYPVVIPLVIKSMMHSYPEIMSKYNEEDFYSEKYLKVKDKIDDLLAKKETKSVDMIKKMKELLGVNEKETITTKDILSEKALDTNSDITQALYKCLDKNDLTTGWTPIHKIELYHSKEDDIVPYTNAEAVVNAFGTDKVKMYRCYNAGHVTTCSRWLGSLFFNRW